MTAYQLLTLENGSPKLVNVEIPDILQPLRWQTISESVVAVPNTAYIIQSNLFTTLLLPETATLGDRIAVIDQGAGGWRIAQREGQQIVCGVNATESGITGRLDSIEPNSVAEIVFVGSNTWRLTAAYGNLDIA